MAICVLLDFHYLAQVPSFTTRSIERVTSALQEFHNHKEAIVCEGMQADWQIPKVVLLQSVVHSIYQLGAVIQWLADVIEHAHIEEIKVPAHAGNNQNYYSQIARHLDCLGKCFHFDLATYITEHTNKEEDGDKDDSDLREDEEDGPDAERCYLLEYSMPTC